MHGERFRRRGPLVHQRAGRDELGARRLERVAARVADGVAVRARVRVHMAAQDAIKAKVQISSKIG